MATYEHIPHAIVGDLSEELHSVMQLVTFPHLFKQEFFRSISTNNKVNHGKLGTEQGNDSDRQFSANNQLHRDLLDSEVYTFPVHKSTEHDYVDSTSWLTPGGIRGELGWVHCVWNSGHQRRMQVRP